MAKNLIPEIAKMLGVEIGEEFKIKGREGAIYKFIVDGLLVSDDDAEKVYTTAHMPLVGLVRGDIEIVKLPWKPKEGEAFYSFYIDVLSLCCGDRIWKVKVWPWDNNPANVAMLRAGWVFRTREEAETALPKVAKELGVEYEL